MFNKPPWDKDKALRNYPMECGCVIWLFLDRITGERISDKTPCSEEHIDRRLR